MVTRWNVWTKSLSDFVQSVMVYGSETWAMKAEDMQRLERTERMIIRWMCGVRLSDKKASAELLCRLDIESVSVVVRCGRLRWFGHVERKQPDDWVSACRHIVVESVKGRAVVDQVIYDDIVLMKTWQS